MIPRRTFLTAGALAAGTAVLPSVAKAAPPDRIARLLASGKEILPDVYEVTDTLVLHDDDVVSDVTLIWLGDCDKPVLHIEGERVSVERVCIHADEHHLAPFFTINPSVRTGLISSCVFERDRGDEAGPDVLSIH